MVLSSFGRGEEKGRRVTISTCSGKGREGHDLYFFGEGNGGSWFFPSLFFPLEGKAAYEACRSSTFRLPTYLLSHIFSSPRKRKTKGHSSSLRGCGLFFFFCSSFSPKASYYFFFFYFCKRVKKWLYGLFLYSVLWFFGLLLSLSRIGLLSRLMCRGPESVRTLLHLIQSGDNSIDLPGKGGGFL